MQIEKEGLVKKMLIKLTVVADIDIGELDPFWNKGDITLKMKEHIERTALDELDYYVEAL
jgi:hypothetical protein